MARRERETLSPSSDFRSNFRGNAVFDIKNRMEPWGFEPQIQPCHGRVIPFHYGPGLRVRTNLYPARPTCQAASSRGQCEDAFLVPRLLRHHQLLLDEPPSV